MVQQKTAQFLSSRQRRRLCPGLTHSSIVAVSTTFGNPPHKTNTFNRDTKSSQLQRALAMASAELTIAKAALSGALFRADPRACTRDDIESMLALLDTAITECSPSNVQV